MLDIEEVELSSCTDEDDLSSRANGDEHMEVADDEDVSTPANQMTVY